MGKRPKRKLIVISNRLPYYKSEDSKGKTVWQKSPGGLVNALDPVLREKRGLWVGWDGTEAKEINDKKINIINVSDIDPAASKKSYKILQVPLTSTEVDKYYTQFSNNTLWGLLHYFFEKSFIDYSTWETYRKVNERFASYISKVASEEDIIWINDFHLFLCPHYLRNINKRFKIHFFLHTPFPHIDLFSTLPWDKEIAESLLKCDSVGFQHSQHMKNFEGVAGQIHGARKPLLYVNPISIDFNRYDQASKKLSVIKWKKDLIKQNNRLRMILGVDRLDYSKGIRRKMLAIGKMIDRYPSLKGKFTFYQIAVPSRESVKAYRTLKKEIDEIVGRINGKYSTATWHPIQYMYSNAPFEELVAFYSAANIALITPLRDGMNLVCKEFVASHSDKKGVLILSKFAGAAAELKNALKVNPYSIEDIMESLYSAITMPPKEEKRRMCLMRKNIKTNDINNWVDNAFRVFETTSKGKRHV